MSRSLLWILLSCTTAVHAVTFVDLTTPPMFGIPRGVVTGLYYGDATNYTAAVTSTNQLAVLNPSLLLFPHRSLSFSRAVGAGSDYCNAGDEEYEQCEQDIFHAMESVEEGFVHAIRDEVDLMFPSPHKHERLLEAAVPPERSAPTTIPQHHHHHVDLSQVRLCQDQHHLYPYDLKGALDKEKEEHNVAHAAQVVEESVVHAIEDEVGTFFPRTATHHSQQAQNEHSLGHVIQKGRQAVVKAIEQEVDTFFPQAPPRSEKPIVEVAQNNKQSKKTKSPSQRKTSRPSRKSQTIDNNDKMDDWHSMMADFLEFTDE